MLTKLRTSEKRILFPDIPGKCTHVYNGLLIDMISEQGKTQLTPNLIYSLSVNRVPFFTDHAYRGKPFIECGSGSRTSLRLMAGKPPILHVVRVQR